MSSIRHTFFIMSTDIDGNVKRGKMLRRPYGDGPRTINERTVTINRDRRLARRFKAIHQWSNEQVIVDEQTHYDRLMTDLQREGII